MSDDDSNLSGTATVALADTTVKVKSADAIGTHKKPDSFVRRIAKGTSLADVKDSMMEEIDKFEHDIPAIKRGGLSKLIGGGSVFGALLSNARENKGLSCGELAEKSNISYGMISRWENGKSLPSPKAFNKLCNALELDETSTIRNVMTRAIKERRKTEKHPKYK